MEKVLEDITIMCIYMGFFSIAGLATAALYWLSEHTRAGRYLMQKALDSMTLYDDEEEDWEDIDD